MRKPGFRFVLFALGALLFVLGVGSTALATDQPDDVIIYVSSSSSGSVDGIDFKDEDILAYNSKTDTWSMHFDGSDLDFQGFNLDAIEVLDDHNDATLDPILFSILNRRTFAGITADDSDIVQFTPSALGDTSAGTFSLFFDGSDHGLTSNNENVDAIGFTPDGRLVISTNGNYNVPKDGGGNLSGSRHDLIVKEASGDWSLYFDGSDVALTTSNEDVWGTWIDPVSEKVYLTTKNQFSVPGLNGDQEDLFTFTPVQLGENTSGSFAAFWNGDTHRFAGERLDGISIAFLNAPPVLGAIGDQSVDEGVALTFTATATDADLPADTLTFSLDAAALADGMSINSTTGAFTWTPTELQGPGTFSATITVTDDGTPNLADSETITITVNEVNEAPVLGAIGNKSVDEGIELAFTATATDSDLPAQGLTFSLAGTVPAGAAITLGGDFTWTPSEAQGPGSYTFDVVVTDDGTPNLADSETITITVNEVNEAPVLGAIGNKSVDEGIELAFTATATDSDLPAQGLTFSLAGTVPAGAAITLGGDFTWTPSEAQGPGSYTFDVVVTDDGTPNLADSETITITVNEVNEAPVLGAIGNKSVDEGIELAFTATATDSDLPAQGLTFSLAGTVPAGAAITLGGDFTWTPSEAQGPGSYTFDVVVTDDGTPNLADSETITITVNEVNEAPVLGAIGNKSVDEGIELAFTATATDSDLPAQGLTFSLAGTVPAGAAITLGGDFTWTPSEAQGPGSYTFDVVVTDDGTPNLADSETITIIVNEVNAAPTIASSASQAIDENLTAAATLTAVDTDIPVQTLTWTKTGGGVDESLFTITAGGALSFNSPPDFEVPADFDLDNFYEVEVEVSDGVASTIQLVTVEVIDVAVENQASVVTPTVGTTAFTEDGGAVVVDASMTVTDGDDANLTSATVTITNIQDAGSEVLAATTGATAISASYVAPILTLTGPDTLANFQAVLQSVTYNNTSENPTEAPDRIINIVANDGTDPSNTALKTVSVTAVNDLPVLTAPSAYDSLGNVGITVPAGSGLLGAATITDTDWGGPFTIGGTVPTATANGGALSINSTTGAFTYTPAAGFVGPTDTFSYQVCDNGTPLPSACSTAQAVTINIGAMLWFVNNAAGAGDGTLQTPFNTLAAFDLVNGNGGANDPSAGDTVFIYSGVGGYTGGVTLENSQILIGQGATASIASIAGITVPTHSTSLPATSGSDPQLAGAGGGIVLASGNTVRGLDITTTSGTALAGASVGALSVSDVDTVSASGGRALDLSGGTASMSVNVGAVTVTSSAVGGINLDNNPGSSTTLGSVAITTTGGTGLNANNAGTVNIGGTASSISSTAGTSVSAVDTTIGTGGWTFASISNDQLTSVSDLSAIVLTNTGSGAFTSNGGTIGNITDVDAIRLSNTDGLVTLANMVIEDIAASGDISAILNTRSGVDGIHGQDVDGGLTLNGTTMRRFSDNAINGTLFSDGLSETNWNGLSILNSTIEDSNRYHVGGAGASGKGDSSDEGLIRIVGITGTVVVDNSTLQRGAELIDFFTDSGAGTLDMTVQRSNFIDSIKEFVCGNPTQNVGKAGIDVTVEGTHHAVIRIGDPAESNAALGNTFTNNATASVRILHDAGTSGDIDVVISQNTFEITDHLTGTDCAPGNFIFNFAQGGVLLGGGAGTFEAIVSNNLFDQVMNADGGLGQLTLIGDDGGDSEFIVTGNEFRLPWQAAARVLADGNNSMAVRFGGPAPGDANTYTDGTLPGVGDDLGGPFPSPFWPWTLNVRNGGALDITLDSEILPLHDAVNSAQPNSFEASMNGSGGTLNIHLENSKSPLGYRFIRSTPTCAPTPACATFNVYRDGSTSTGIQAILQDNGNTGGGGFDGTTPPDVVTSGTIGFTDTAPTLPSITIP